MLPGVSGFDLLRRIRARSRTPVLMLTARGDDVDRIVGLELGADDYLSKPFNPRELVARIRAILRRTAPDGGPAPGDRRPERLSVDDLEVDVGSHVVRRAAVRVELTAVRVTQLEGLLRGPGAVVHLAGVARVVPGRSFWP